MFRKVKKGGKANAGMRRRRSSEDSDEEKKRSSSSSGSSDAVAKASTSSVDRDEEEKSTAALLSEARKRTKLSTDRGTTSTTHRKNDTAIMHTYNPTTEEARKRKEELVTSTVQIHSENQVQQMQAGAALRGDDGIFRDKTRSKLLAGPIKAASHIRTTCRFDYQPDICKDYKDTGFCGFGDTCIYLHDRGDTLSGWQLEQKWEEEQRKKKELQEKQIQGFLGNQTNQQDEQKNAALNTDDGLPFACHICRQPFTNPVVTACGHYFCEPCILNRVRTESETCPICSKDTHGVFNQPAKLLQKKRKVLGLAASKKPDSWNLFANAFSNKQQDQTELI